MALSPTRPLSLLIVLAMLMPLGLMGSSASGPRTGPDDTGPDDDTGLIHLKYANFDPSAGKPQVPSHLASLDDSRLALVQLEGATQPGWYSTLEDQGLTILRYIPQYTYLVFENGQGGLERRDRDGRRESAAREEQCSGRILPAARGSGKPSDRPCRSNPGTRPIPRVEHHIPDPHRDRALRCLPRFF